MTALMVWIAAASAVFGAAFIQNPSFESNFNTNWPYYQQPGWPGATGIDGWTATGGYGVNDRTYDRAGPFHDNGVTPDRSRVAFKQQGGDFSQVISGLTAGKLYWIQFYYNSRGDTLGGKLRHRYPVWRPGIG